MQADGAPRGFFGHPRALSTLFFTELWERFSYYGMRAFLVLFMVAPIDAGGLGFSTATMSSFIMAMQVGMWFGYVTFGFISDSIGRRRA